VVEDPAMGRDMGCRILTHQEWYCRQLDPMDSGKNLAALARHYHAGGGEMRVTDNSRTKRFSCNPFGDIALSQLIGGLHDSQHPGRGGTSPLRRDHQPRLISGVNFGRNTGNGVCNLGAELDNQFPALSCGLCVEGERRAIGTARQALEIADRSRFADMVNHRGLKARAQVHVVHFVLGVSRGCRNRT
jgi:hypothetical protein